MKEIKADNRLYKYSGAGNDFIVLDSRDFGGECGPFREAATIRSLCDRNSGFRAADGRIGADGLMILSPSDNCDFSMEYFNSDGSGGMMCGNGGRCIVAFASHRGILPSKGGTYLFEAPDGLHSGEILSSEGLRDIVRLRMIDPFGLRTVLGGHFLNTGTRHFVLFTDDVEKTDVEGLGATLRHDPEFAPEGANVNFASIGSDGVLKIRTFEKGVEAETLACGTGITAAAIVAHIKGISPSSVKDGRLFYNLDARTDRLSVDFLPGLPGTDRPATDVFLTGPATRV